MMSNRPHAEPGATKMAYFNQDFNHQTNPVDIYVSAESLKVYENPWVDGSSSSIPGPTATQHTASSVSEKTRKKNQVRADSVLLGLLCLVLVIGIICLGLRMKKDNSDLRREVNQLEVNYTKLIKAGDDLFKKCCRDPQKKPNKCRKQSWY